MTVSVRSQPGEAGTSTTITGVRPSISCTETVASSGACDSHHARTSSTGQADKVIAIGHSGKFGKHGFARILPFDGVDVLVTDKNLSEEFETELTGAGVHLVKS